MTSSPEPSPRFRILGHLLAATVCFCGVLLVSRLVDLGVVPGDSFGAGDWRRSVTGLYVLLHPADGSPPHALGGDSVLRPGDELEFGYGRTRYSYLWLFKVDRKGALRCLVPSGIEVAAHRSGDEDGATTYGYRVQPQGERVPIRYRVLEDDNGTMVGGFLTGVPYRWEELEALARDCPSKLPERVIEALGVSGHRFWRTLRVIDHGG